MTEWHEALRELLNADERCALVSVAEVRGSAPREAGATMLVTPHAQIGTIGGGQLEFEATRVARAALRVPTPFDAKLERYPLGPALGQCCGGHVRLLYQVIDPEDQVWPSVHPTSLFAVRTATPRAAIIGGARLHGSLGDAALDAGIVDLPPGLHRLRDAAGEVALCVVLAVQPSRTSVAVFGAGHVGRAFIEVAAPLPWQVRWIDSRRLEFPGAVPANVEVVCVDDPVQAVDTLPSGTRCLVMTHSHPLDLALVARLLPRADLPFCGLIGSLTKRRRFERQLRDLGLTTSAIARLTCPIGVDGVDSKLPAAIAVAAAAQLLTVASA